MRLKLFISFWFGVRFWVVAQSPADSSRYSAVHTFGVIGIASSANRTPFWLSTNQYGVVPRTSPAGVVQASTVGRLRLGNRFPHSLTYGIEAVGQATRQPDVVIPQAYASLNVGRFSLWGGRKKEIIGLGDSTLTSGFYSWSGNALPITKIQVETNGFVPIGFTRNQVSVQAFYAHGWFANTDSIQGSYLHQKALYVRIGRPNARVRLTGGVLHNVQWGGRSATLPANVAINGQLPQSFSSYLYVVTAREPNPLDSAGYSKFDAVNRFGNHLGSIDFSLELRLGRWRAMGYHQHPFEDKSGVVFINFPDGLYGLSLINPAGSKREFTVQRLSFEFLSTLSQSGSLTHTGSRYDGKDDYFNNYQYRDGWVQNQRVIGTPFLSRRADLRPERQQEPGSQIWAIANNEVQVWHMGAAGTVGRGVRWQTKLSASRNAGTPRHPFVQAVSQFSGALWLTWPLAWLGGSELQTAIALDQGQLYQNSAGGWLSLRKTWKTTQK